MRSSHHLLTLKEQKMRELQASLHSEVGGGRRGGGEEGREVGRMREGGMGRRGEGKGKGMGRGERGMSGMGKGESKNGEKMREGGSWVERKAG